MLKAMRGAAQGWIAKTLFIILLGSFAVWGIGPIFRGGRIHNAAKAGSVTISTTEADQAFQQQVRAMEQQYGMSLPPEIIAQLGLKRQVVQQMVMQSLFDQEAARVGLRMGREMVMQTISTQPIFRGENGKFDPARFRSLLSNMGMRESDYVNMLRSDIIRTLLMGGVRSGSTVPTLLARNVYAWENETRNVSAVEVTGASMTNVPSPKPEELAKYHADHADRYMAPEYRAINFVTIDQAKVAASIKLTDDEVKAAYDQAPGDFSEAEKRNIVQVTTNDKALAEKIAAEATARPLADVVKENNLMLRPLEGLTKAGTLPQLADLIFSLEANKPSPAIQSPMGWHVIQVTKITPANIRSFAEVRSKVEESLRSQKAADAAFELSKKLQDTLASGATLIETAQQLGLTVTKLDAVSGTGETPAGTKADSSPYLNDVLKMAFEVQQGEATQVSENASGFFVAQVESITPSQLRPLENVKSEVTAAWTAAKRLEMAEAKANEQADQLRKGSTLPGLTPISALKRNGNNKGSLPESVMEHIFTAKLGDVLTAKTDDSVWIVKVTGINPVKLDGADLKATTETLKESLANDLLEQFGTALRVDYGIEINEAWIKQTSTVQ